MTRRTPHEIDSLLREQRPPEARAPSWVRTRALAALDEPQTASTPQRSRAPLRFALAVPVLAALAVGITLWTRPAPQPANTPESIRLAVPSPLPVNLRVPALTAPYEDEAQRLRRDATQFMDAVRVPMEKISRASRQLAGSV